MRHLGKFTTLTAIILMVGLPTMAFQKQSTQPWWVDFLAEYQQAAGDGLRFQWNTTTQQIDVFGEIEFVFTNKSSILDPRVKELMLSLYRSAVKRYWSLPFDGSEERADVTACGQYFGGFNFDGIVFRMAAAEKPVVQGASRVYFFYNSEIPKPFQMQQVLHATFPTISGPEGFLQEDPFWVRKGEAVLPAFTQFLPLPKQTGLQLADEFGPRDPSTSSWFQFVGHEFGHTLGLPDGWFFKEDQIVATDTELMSFLFWELNPEPRTTHYYFADILTRLFLCEVSWEENGKTHWVGPGQ